MLSYLSNDEPIKIDKIGSIAIRVWNSLLVTESL